MAGDVRRRFAAWTVQSDFPLAELPASSAPPDWHIVRDPSAAVREGARWYQRADAADGFPWVWFGRRNGEDIVRFPGLGWSVLTDQRIACVWRKHLPAEDAEHLLLNHVLPMAASRAGFLVMHASVLVRPGGGAVAFTGPVGAGKSTIALALASYGWRVLSDDRLVIDEQRVAYPIGSYLRVAPIAAERFRHHAVLPEGHHKVRLRANGPTLAACADAVTLERIVVIDGASTRTIARPLSGREASIAVLTSVLQLGLDQPAVQARVFERVGSLAAAVPITKLRIEKRWERLSEIESALRTA